MGLASGTCSPQPPATNHQPPTNPIPHPHRMYAQHMPGVVADFELSVRRTPLPLHQIRREVRSAERRNLYC